MKYSTIGSHQILIAGILTLIGLVLCSSVSVLLPAQASGSRKLPEITPSQPYSRRRMGVTAGTTSSTAKLGSPLVTGFSDGTFNDSAWTASKLIDTTAGMSASFTAGQVAAGGNPGSYRQTTHTFSQGQIVVGHLRTGVIYDPSTQGAVSTIDFSYDLIHLDPNPGQAVLYRLLVFQNSSYYTSNFDDLTFDPTWTSFSHIGLTAANFSKLTGAGPASPDFSASGAPIQLGYISANTSDGGTLVRQSGIDNWSVSVRQCVAPPSGMVSWWLGDGNAADIQSGHNGTLQGGATFGSGEVGQGFSLNGTSAYISIPDTPDLYPAGSFTVDAWIKTSQATGTQIIIAHYECGNSCPTGATSVYALYIDNGKLTGQIRDTAGLDQVLAGTTMIADGVFHHVALLRNTSSGQMILYRDGTIEASATLVATGVLKDDDGEADPVTIGSIIENSFSGCGCPIQLFSGVIDEVEYFNRALSQTEIQGMFNAGSAGKCRACTPPPSQMVSWWPGDGNANDIQGGHNGTLESGVTFAAGEVAQAFQFDGNGGGVNIGNSADFDFATDASFTIDAWIKYIGATDQSNDGQAIVMLNYDCGNTFQGLSLQNQGANLGRPVFEVRDINGNGGLIVGTTPLSSNTFHHIAGVREVVGGTKTVRLYVDGVLVSSVNDNSTGALAANFTDFIGRRNLCGTLNPFNGLIDEVEIFSRALTASEIQAIVNAGNAGKCKPQSCSIMCPGNITKSNDPGQCGAVVNYPAPTTTGTCGTVTCNPPSGSVFMVGMTTVNCSTTAGPACSFKVTVNDTQAPSIACPPNITAVTSQTLCAPTGTTPCANVTFAAPTVGDNCPGVTAACTPPSGSCFPAGTTTVTCTAMDASGNTATCSFTVTTFDVCVQDDSNPSTALLWNSATGAYRFCCSGTIYTGTGTVVRQGCIFTLTHNAVDRRVAGKIDKSVSKGTASIQSPAGSIRCTIFDRDTTNNACNCK